MKNLYILKQNGYVSKIIGETSDNDMSLAILVQARSKPKHPFKAFIELSKVLTARPLAVFVDNLYSQVFFERTDEEQSLIDNEYSKFFSDLGCVVYFSKNVFFKNDPSLFNSIINLALKFSYKEFFNSLPYEKRVNIERLSQNEIVHFLMEMHLMNIVKNYKYNVLLIGHSSQAIVAAHRNSIKNPLTAIVVPRFKNFESVDSYVSGLQNYKRVFFS